jgi:tRNA(fMet)-specific endonuclease VapC
MAFNSARIAENTPAMAAAIDQFELWRFDERAAEEFGKIKADLRKKGRPIQDVDVQIAAIPNTNHLTLLSADGGFAAVEQLLIENWLRP